MWIDLDSLMDDFAGIRGVYGVRGEIAFMHSYLENKHKLSTLVLWL
jgi:hypothetical protein